MGTVGLVSLGCAKNQVDLQVMVGHLLKAGWRVAPNPDEADVLLINTCAFIEDARAEAVNEIARACELKAAGAVKKIVVAGCLPQRYGAARLAELFPAVDVFVGIDELDKISRIIAKGSKMVAKFGAPCKVFNPPSPALRLNAPAFAYLKIAEGCCHKCAYCAIPGIRGKYRSRSVASLIKEARALIATGAKELNIIAQDPMLYGVDLHDGTNLVTLLKKLDALKGDFWLRVLYSYPSEITDEFLEWMSISSHAVHYIDVPLQHTSPKVLKAMARGAAAKASLTAASRIRAAIPDVTLRTTLMAGFPGETDDDWAQLLRDVEAMQFDRLGAFVFSPEEGTAAARITEGIVPTKVARQRVRTLMALQRRIAATKNKAIKGKVFRALVVQPQVARLASQAPDVDGVTLLERPATPGTFINVRITKVRGYDLCGSQVE